MTANFVPRGLRCEMLTQSVVNFSAQLRSSQVYFLLYFLLVRQFFRLNRQTCTGLNAEDAAINTICSEIGQQSTS